jgi:predicted dehydrogenase
MLIIAPLRLNSKRDFALILPTRQDYKLEGIGIYGQMITLFTDCILQDRQPPTSLANGRHSVKVVDAIYRAVRERRVVEVGA